MVVSYSGERDSFRAGRPRLWSEGQFTDRGTVRNFALHPDGKVYAVEISQESLDYIMKEAEKEGHANIAPVLGEHRTTNLSRDSADVIVTIRTYHHFEYPVDMLESIKAALRPEGRFVVIDQERIKGVSSERTLEHRRAGKGTITDEILDAGFVLEKELPLIPDFYYVVFKER